MAEEKRYRKKRNEGKPIVFLKDERWIQMKDLSDGSYYISDFGRVSRLNPQGIFHEIKQSFFCKSYYVSIEIEGKDRKVHTRKRVGKLVLNYFVGGVGSVSDKRRYIHLNGDKSNCRLTNLRWRKGFIDDVDFKFLSEINATKMSEESIIIRNYLITEDVKPIFELLKEYESLLRYKDFMNNTKYLKNNDFIGFCLIIIDKLKEGKFKPNVKHKEIISFRNFVTSTFVSTSYQYRTMREFNLFEHTREIGVMPNFGSIESNPVFF